MSSSSPLTCWRSIVRLAPALDHFLFAEPLSLREDRAPLRPFYSNTASGLICKPHTSDNEYAGYSLIPRSACEAQESSSSAWRRSRPCNCKIPEPSVKSPCWTTTSASPLLVSSPPISNLRQLTCRPHRRRTYPDRQSAGGVPESSIDGGGPGQHRVHHQARRGDPAGESYVFTTPSEDG